MCTVSQELSSEGIYQRHVLLKETDPQVLWQLAEDFLIAALHERFAGTLFCRQDSVVEVGDYFLTKLFSVVRLLHQAREE